MSRFSEAAAAYANPTRDICITSVSPIAEKPVSPVNPDLGSYRITETQRQRSRLFRSYIARTHACRFHIRGNIMICGVRQPHDKSIEYIHRWTASYRKAVISKFYQLEEWWKKNPLPVTLLTLTTYQDGEYSVSMKGGVTTIEEAFDLLKKGWRWLSVWLRKYCPGVLYVHVMEPHKSGYPHLHVELFGFVPESIQDDIRRLWSQKYKIGSAEHGVDFTIRNPEQGISSIKNYLLKHIAKTLVGGRTGSKFETGLNDWTPGELLFNATIKAHKWRLWGASLVLSKIMAHRKPARIDYEWVSTELIDENGDAHLVGGVDETGYLVDSCIGCDPPEDSDDLCPEGMATRSLWKRGYDAEYCVLKSRESVQVVLL